MGRRRIIFDFVAMNGCTYAQLSLAGVIGPSSLLTIHYFRGFLANEWLYLGVASGFFVPRRGILATI